MKRFAFALLILMLAAEIGFGQTNFSSASTNEQGAFPPSTFLAALTNNDTCSSASNCTVTLDLKTGLATLTNTIGAPPSPVTLPGGSAPDAFPSGELNFTTFTVPANSTLRFVGNSLNAPVTIRASGDVTILGTIDMRGGNGSTAGGSCKPSILVTAGKGGAGGYNAGLGGTTAGQNGGSGLGNNGGAGSAIAFGSGGATEFWGRGGKFPHANSNLYPLIGGSGGGGGAGTFQTGCTQPGASGGGGGGAILIASSTKIVARGTIDVRGGDGGPGATNSDTGGGAGPGGGGAGGAIRLIANTIQANSQLWALGGAGGCAAGGCNGQSPGGNGMIRLEAATFTTQFGDNTTNGMGVAPPAVTGLPSIIRPLNLPGIRISSVGGTTVGDPFANTLAAGTRSFNEVAVSSSTNPMAVEVTATSIPDGTEITVVLKMDNGTSTATGSLAAGKATINLVIPTGVSILQAFTATFQVSRDLQRELPLIDGEKVLAASVEFDGSQPHTYFFTASGARMSAEELLGRGF